MVKGKKKWYLEMLIYEGKVSRFERFVSDGEFFGEIKSKFQVRVDEWFCFRKHFGWWSSFLRNFLSKDDFGSTKKR